CVPPTPTTDIHTLSLHDALPIYRFVSNGPGDTEQRGTFTIPVRADLRRPHRAVYDLSGKGIYAVVTLCYGPEWKCPAPKIELLEDRKSTRLNSSHRTISYAVFCL